MLSVVSPYPQFFDLTGLPLDGGKIYIGTAGLNPLAEANRITIYQDKDGTQPLAQPLRTQAGYIVSGSSPIRVYPSADDFSIAIYDKKGRLVVYEKSATSLANIQENLARADGGLYVGFAQEGDGAVVTNMRDQMRGQPKLISNYLSLAAAFTLLGGGTALGYGLPRVFLDLQGQSVDIGSGDLYWPLNVRLMNGDVRSTTGGRLILCSPYVRNPGLRAKEAYWPYMIGSGCDRVSFNCLTIISGLLRGVFRDSLWEQEHSHLVLVNSNGLWTEYNQFPGCEFAAQGGSQAILLDGNLSGTSPYSVGAGAGTADGSFGYNMFPQCKLDSTAPKVGMQIDGGGVLYGSLLQFRGYARGAGGAMIYLPTGAYYNRIGYSNFDIAAESFGTAANIVSVESAAQLWYNTGSIRSASPEMTFNNGAGADLRANNLFVEGPVLQDSAGNPVFNGGTQPTIIFDNLNRRRGVQPMFRAHRSADDTFPSGTTKQISMDAIDADTDSSAYTGGGFSPKFAGWYRVTGKVRVQATGTASACSLELRLNGVAISINGFGALGASMERDIDELLFLNGTTDVVTLHVLATDAAGPPTIIGSSTATSIAANFVRA